MSECEQAEATHKAETESVRGQIFGAQEERILGRLAGLDPDLMAYIRDFAYDTVYERPGLDLKTKE
jgi:4-carboxymuconolactone decarboxylase